MITYRLRKLRTDDLVGYAQDGVEEALSLLVERYQNMVLKISNQYYGNWAEKSDIIQNGYVGLLKAIYYYKPDKEANFNTFTWTNIHSEIKTFLTYLNRKKNKILTESFSFDYSLSSDSEDEEMEAYLALNERDTDEVVNEQLSVERTKNRMKEVLTAKEIRIFEMYTESFTYLEIAEKYAINTKRVDNVIQKCRRKFKIFFEEEMAFLRKSEEFFRRAI